MLPPPPAARPGDAPGRDAAPVPAGWLAAAGEAAVGLSPGPARNSDAMDAGRENFTMAMALAHLDAIERGTDSVEEVDFADPLRPPRGAFQPVLDRLALEHVAPHDVLEMIEETRELANACLSGTPTPGTIVPGLVERIERDRAGLLEIWTRHARPASFWENMLRLAIFSSLIDVTSEGGLPALNALRERADEVARRLVRMYARYGVVEGATIDSLSDVLTSDANYPDLSFSEGMLRGLARMLSLALIARLPEPGFEDAVTSLIQRELGPDGEWPALGAEGQLAPTVAATYPRDATPSRREVWVREFRARFAAVH